MKKVFVLGVGAQKCGTTWLYNYLADFSFSNFGIRGNYHIWDALYASNCQNFIVKPQSIFSKNEGGINDELCLRYSMQNYSGIYEGYFSSLCSSDSWLTGDISPAYGCLTSDIFSLIKSKLESVGFEVKVIFLMRDPIERCWSAVRMYKRVNRFGNSIGINDEDALKEQYCDSQMTPRTMYNKTINELENVFSPDNVYLGIYENMFETKQLEALCKFLKIPTNIEFTKNKFNVSEKQEVIPEKLKSEIREYYQEVYDYCNTRFPETLVLWN